MKRQTVRHLGELMMAAGATMIISQVVIFNIFSVLAGFLLFFVGVEIYLNYRLHHEDAVETSDPTES